MEVYSSQCKINTQIRVSDVHSLNKKVPYELRSHLESDIKCRRKICKMKFNENKQLKLLNGNITHHCDIHIHDNTF